MPRDYKPTYSPRFEVDVGGDVYQEPGGRIADLVVESTLDGADRFSFTLNWPFDPEFGDFGGMTWSDFEVGTEVGVKMGWGGSGSLEPMVAGRINAVSADFAPDRGPSVSVSGYGLLHDMMRGTGSVSWNEVKLGDVVDEVLSSHFGDRTVDGANLKLEKVYQHEESDYRFVRRLADTYGFRFYADREAAFFEPRSSVGGGDPVATLVYGAELDSFSAEITESNEVGEVQVRYYDMANEKEVVGTATKKARSDETEVYRVPCQSKEEAEQIAATRLARFSGSTASGHGEADGLPAVTAGTTVTLEELGERFSTNYYITKATHRMGGSGYRTSFEATEVPE